ncbi:hypothetical protein ABEV15_02020 [Bhargavaea massiliensis]
METKKVQFEFEEILEEQLLGTVGGGEDLMTDLGYFLGWLVGNTFNPKNLKNYKMVGVYPGITK